jgi:hypothetical protein
MSLFADDMILYLKGPKTLRQHGTFTAVILLCIILDDEYLAWQLSKAIEWTTSKEKHDLNYGTWMIIPC